jgi:hypothetical protein
MRTLDEKILDAVLPGWKYKNQMPTPNFVYKIKIAVKELVEECKPEFISPDQPLGLKYQGRNEAIRDFEQNILKALGEI